MKEQLGPSPEYKEETGTTGTSPSGKRSLPLPAYTWMIISNIKTEKKALV